MSKTRCGNEEQDNMRGFTRAAETMWRSWKLGMRTKLPAIKPSSAPVDWDLTRGNVLMLASGRRRENLVCKSRLVMREGGHSGRGWYGSWTQSLRQAAWISP